MISVGIPIKMWYYQQSDENFNKYEQTNVNLYAITIIFLLFLYIFLPAFRMIERQTLKEGTSKSSLSAEVAKNLKKRDLQKATIIETLKSTLHCEDLEATEIYYHHVNETSELVTAKANIEYLLKVGVSRETIIENGFLLPMPWSMIFPSLLFI